MNQEHVTYSAFVELKKQYKKINVIDVGAAKVFDLIDYEFEDNNGTQMSDIVFVNRKEL